jgi:hypothetical protein
MNNNNKNLEKKPFDKKAYDKEYQKEYRKKNADKNKTYQKVYQSLNAEKIKKQRDLYKKENKEKIKNNRIKNKEKTKIYNKAYREKKKEEKGKCSIKPKIRTFDRKKYSKKYQIENAKKLKEYQKDYRIKNKEKLKKLKNLDYIKNIEKYKNYHKKYREEKKEELKINKRKYVKIRRNEDILFKLISNLRSRLRSVMKYKNTKKCKKTLELTGCTLEFLYNYLESKFTKGMSWDNYGKFGWHIDHILPCSSFDMSNPEEQKKCFHYANLQPLWWLDNLKKSNKML